MSTKWTEKDVLEHAQALRSPFENVNHKPSSPDSVLQAIKARGVSRQPVPKVGEEMA